MINVTSLFKQELFNDNRHYLEYVDITLSGGGKTLNLENDDLWGGGLTIEDSVSKDNTFDIGSAIINKCTVVINNIYDKYSEYDFGNATVLAYVGLQLPDGTIEKIRKGTFIVDEAKYNGSIITLSCLDKMSKFDRKYSDSTLSYPATLNQIVRDACEVCGVSLQTYNFPHDSFIVQTRPNDEATTFREVISWCAQIACCFCRCDTLGRLEIKWYDQEALEVDGLNGGIFDSSNQEQYVTGDHADGGNFNPWNTGYEADGGAFGDRNNLHMIYSLYSMDISVDDVVITGVKIEEKNKEDNKDAITTYQSGTDGYVVSIEKNELIKGGAGQTIVGWLGEQLIGFRFRRANISHSSDPTIEAGDVGLLIDRKQNIYPIPISFTKFSTGGSQNTKASAQNPARNSAARFSAETKIYVDYRRDIEKERTDREKALEELGVRIDNSPGLFTTEVTQDNGSTIFYMHDKPNLAESMIVWKMTAEAWGVSTDGGGTYNAGMTVDGDTIVRILTATGVNADWIKTGALKIQKGNKTMVDMDFDAKRVEIRPDVFALSNGDTIQDIAEAVVDGQTQEDFVNKLTNDGASKGIYLLNNELYMNASYIKTGEVSADRINGGTLTLGGLNNENGKITMKDENGDVIGGWTNNGINIKKGTLNGDILIYLIDSLKRTSIFGFGGAAFKVSDRNTGTDCYIGMASGDIKDTLYIDVDSGFKLNFQSGDTVKLLYTDKAYGICTADSWNFFCNVDFHNYSIKNAYIDELKVTNSFNIPNYVDCNIYSNIDFHNYEIQNAKIISLAGVDGSAPYTGSINFIAKIENGISYPAIANVKSGIITGVSSNAQ